MDYRSPSQKFKFDIPLLINFCKIIKEKGKIDSDIISNSTGINTPKVDENIKYLEFCDLVDEKGISYFGNTIIKLEKNHDFIEPLLLYKLSRSGEQGGHYYYNILINYVLYDIAFRINNIAKEDEILDNAVKIEKDLNYCKDSYEIKRRNFGRALRTGLSDSTTGFGKMGVSVKQGDIYEISGFVPHKLVTAFILYDNWPSWRNELKISEIITSEYLPGRIFFMGEDEVKQQLHELEQDGLIFIERQAGLNQVRLNGKYCAEDILDRMVEYDNTINSISK